MNKRETLARSKFLCQERIAQIVAWADLPPEVMWERKDVLLFMRYMERNILNRKHEATDDAVYAIAKDYLAKHFSLPAKRTLIGFAKVNNPEKWEPLKGFWLPNWPVVRWVLRRFGAKVVDPRSLVI
jgi:hypothetical protein